jgi:vacuolar-type H+-ATPase catalytic subunit A/Vma1
VSCNVIKDCLIVDKTNYARLYDDTHFILVTFCVLILHESVQSTKTTLTSRPKTQHTIVEVAKIIREDFLAQNAYSPYDPCCPFYKSVWMLKNICLFYSLALKAVELSSGDRKINLNTIKQHMGKTIYKITAMKFEDPKDGEEVITAKYKALYGTSCV